MYRVMNMALSICYWANYTQNKLKLTRKYENAVNSDHVLQFLFDEETAVVDAVVQASMPDTSCMVFCLGRAVDFVKWKQFWGWD
jgi:hypothetical protein